MQRSPDAHDYFSPLGRNIEKQELWGRCPTCSRSSPRLYTCDKRGAARGRSPLRLLLVSVARSWDSIHMKNCCSKQGLSDLFFFVLYHFFQKFFKTLFGKHLVFRMPPKTVYHCKITLLKCRKTIFVNRDWNCII